jgi:hypothetical protein
MYVCMYVFYDTSELEQTALWSTKALVNIHTPNPFTDQTRLTSRQKHTSTLTPYCVKTFTLSI